MLVVFYLSQKYEGFKMVEDPMVKIDAEMKKEGVEFIEDGRYGGYPTVFPDIGNNTWNTYWDVSKREMVPNDAYFDFSSPFIRKDL